MTLRSIFLFMAFLLPAGNAGAQDYFKDFPVRANPEYVGQKLSNRLMETKHQLYGGRGIHYADTQWALPSNAKPEEIKFHKKGCSWQTRLWIDDMFMITVPASMVTITDRPLTSGALTRLLKNDLSPGRAEIDASPPGNGSRFHDMKKASHNAVLFSCSGCICPVFRCMP